MKQKPKIKNAKQKRAINELLKGMPIPVKDIGPLIGALNPRQCIMELRRQGFYGIIITERYNSINEYGEKTRPGEYHLAPGFQNIVEEAIRIYDAKAVATAEAKLAKLKLNNNNGD